MNLQLSEKEKKIKELMNEIQSLESKLKMLNSTTMDYSNLDMKYKALEAKYQTTEALNKELDTKNDQLGEKNDQLERKLRKLESDNFKVETMKTTINNLLKAYEDEMKAMNQHTNTRCLLKEAELNHFEKEIQFLKIKLNDSYNQINILNYHLSASEKQLFKYDPDALNQQRQIRKEAFEKLSKELEHVLYIYIYYSYIESR